MKDHPQKIIKMRNDAVDIVAALRHAMKQVVGSVFCHDAVIAKGDIPNGGILLRCTEQQQIRL